MISTNRPTKRLLAAVVGVVIVGGGWLLPSLASEDAIDTGPETGLSMIDNEIALMEQRGVSPDDEVMRSLLEERARLEKLATEPPPPPPDPAEVSRLLAIEPSPPQWDSGEIECEGSLATKEAEFTKPPRCVAVPRPNGDLLTAYLTDEGWAFVTVQVYGGSEPGRIDIGREDIPVIKDLQSARLELVDEQIMVVTNEDQIKIETRLWLSDPS
ncbi:MAG TPA: hypothetical protein VE569_04540 [Acidimicrobiia bacterium]|jgi:hypothetical protein|nr:hypothetical protein [Acidimicrobiia bacterium]